MVLPEANLPQNATDFSLVSPVQSENARGTPARYPNKNSNNGKIESARGTHAFFFFLPATQRPLRRGEKLLRELSWGVCNLEM